MYSCTCTSVSDNFIRCIKPCSNNPSIRSSLIILPLLGVSSLIILPLLGVSCRTGLWPPRYTTPCCDEWGQVYLWLHGALLLPGRPPAHWRLFTHLSVEWTLERTTAPLFRYTDALEFNGHRPYVHICDRQIHYLLKEIVILV